MEIEKEKEINNQQNQEWLTMTEFMKCTLIIDPIFVKALMGSFDEIALCTNYFQLANIIQKKLILYLLFEPLNFANGLLNLLSQKV